MATLEAIRGGGGSIRVGTVGTISSLMTRELESSKSSSFRHTPGRQSLDNILVKPRKSKVEASSSAEHTNPQEVSKTRGLKTPDVPILSVKTPRRPKQKTPLEDVGNSRVRPAMIKKSPGSSGKTKSHRSNSQIPMLGSENIHLEKTPTRDMSMKKKLNIVDIVDVNCGNPSVSNKLKKLGFSKLSRSFM